MDVVVLSVRHPGVPVLAPEGGRGWDHLRRARCGGQLRGVPVLGDPEDHLHVVAGAPAAHPTVDVLGVTGGDEVVVAARPELQAPGGRREGPEGDGEVHEGLRPVTDGHDPWPGVGHAAAVKLLLLDAVDDVLLGVEGAGFVDRTDEVDLVVLGGRVALVHDHCGGLAGLAGRSGVPVDVADTAAGHCGERE